MNRDLSSNFNAFLAFKAYYHDFNDVFVDLWRLLSKRLPIASAILQLTPSTILNFLIFITTMRFIINEPVIDAPDFQGSELDDDKYNYYVVIMLKTLFCRAAWFIIGSSWQANCPPFQKCPRLCLGHFWNGWAISLPWRANNKSNCPPK